MKRGILACFIVLFSCHTFAQDTFDLSAVSHLGLDIVEIITKDGEMPTCDFADAPEGCMGSTCINQNKVPCRVIISHSGKTLYDSGDYEKGVSGATIRINGNTSSFEDNKPYKIKLQKKADLLNRNDDKYEDKNWRLLRDATTLNTMIGLKVNELLDLPWTPAYKPCNVFLNNEYQGCYLLIESVERNSDCRLNVSKKTGYIVERDAYWWNEDHYFATPYFEPYKGYRWTWKYPDEDDVTQEQQQYIQSYINSAEQSIKDGTYEQYINVASFARWLLAHDILGTWDSGGSNLYVMKYDDTQSSLLEMGNLWDFDTIMKMPEGDFSRYHDSSYDFYYQDLFSSTNRHFTETYQQLWNEVKTTLREQLSAFINTYIDSKEAKALQLSRELHVQRWNSEMRTVKEDADLALDWFNNHLQLLDEKISHINTSIIIHPTSEDHHKTYNLLGIETHSVGKGIYISQGRKYVVK